MKSHYRCENRFKLAGLAVLVFTMVQVASGTALDDYVAAPDANYTYHLESTIPGIGYTAYVLDMNSQGWRSSAEVNRTVWQHWLTIVKPHTASGNTALLFINGGSNGGSPPDSVDMIMSYVALTANTVVADLRMVPNQPLTFTDDGQPRSEDEIISYTFDKYLTTGDANWPLLLPMVKSAVRAMDTVNSYVLDITGGAVDVNEFLVSGASKRGWTTWLTAAVDSRVIAIVPAVIDVLNLDVQMRHHFSADGFYSDAIHDYVDMNIFDRLDDPNGQALLQIVDPYEYRQRYGSLPKYGINSSGDQFFVSDSAQFYFHDLPDPNNRYLRYMPNTDHDLETDAYFSLLVFYQSVLAGSPRPQLSWTVQQDGSIVVDTKDTPTQVKLWQATNATTRDFRLETIGAVWTSSTLTDQGGGVYIAEVNEPPAGWTAFFVELFYDSNGLAYDYKFTTEINVVPYYLPFGLDVDITPNTLNLSSKGRWITCRIWLPEDWDVADINSCSIFYGDEEDGIEIKASRIWFDEQEQVVMAKFDRDHSEVEEMLVELYEIDELGKVEVELTVSGELANGTRFGGTDTIRVIDKGGKKK